MRIHPNSDHRLDLFTFFLNLDFENWMCAKTGNTEQHGGLSTTTRIGSTIPSQITIVIIIFQSVRRNLKLHITYKNTTFITHTLMRWESYVIVKILRDRVKTVDFLAGIFSNSCACKALQTFMVWAQIFSCYSERNISLYSKI